MSGIFRFRVHRTGIPVQTTLGVTDRSCITFCVSASKLHELSGPLEHVYQHLRSEISNLGKQELQRILPLIWSSGRNRLPNFFAHQNVAFLDFRGHAKQQDTKIQNRIQEILISMDIPCHFQKRSILVLYASGTLLETFRQVIFHENIILPFGKEEGCFQCSLMPNAQQNSWQVELQIIGSTKYEAYQIEDDGTLLTSNGDVLPELIRHLAQEYDASNIRTAIVHVQGKGQQRIVAFLANSNIQPQIPCVFKDHQGVDRILQYKQPDVLADPQMSNVHVKEMRADNHTISQAKGINQHARISAFFPFPRNDLSRRRFNRVKSFNVCANRCDILCTVLDETVPVCLVNQELSIQDVAILLEFLFHKQPILNHHSAFLTCSLDSPDASIQCGTVQEDILSLPYFSSIVHCHLSCNQFLTIYQPRFEDGKVSRCIGNSLQLSVYERTDIVLFLTGQLEIFDLFETAPKGRIIAVWKVADTMPTKSCPPYEAVSQNFPSAGNNSLLSDDRSLGANERCVTPSQTVLRKSAADSKGPHQSATSIERTTPLSAEGGTDTSNYKAGPSEPPSDLRVSPQSTHATKRGHSSLESLVRKVPVPKLPGAPDIGKNLLVEPKEDVPLMNHPIEKPGGQASVINEAGGNLALHSRQTNCPTADTLEQSGFLAANGNAAPTQIDTELASNASQCETFNLSHDCQSKPPQSEDLLRLGAAKGTIEETEDALVHDKGVDNAEAYNQSIQRMSIAASSSCQYRFSKNKWSILVPGVPVPSGPPTEIDQVTQETFPGANAPQEFDCRLDKSAIEEIIMQDANLQAEKVDDALSDCGVLEPPAQSPDTEPANLCTPSARSAHEEQPEEYELNNEEVVINLSDNPTVPPLTGRSSSFAERRFLAHMHTLKQLVASKESLINTAFVEDDFVQAAKLYDNLNATACFYTTALRLLSKADWQERVDFEEHIVHQALIAVARGWTTAVGVRTLSFDKHHLALSMATLPLTAHGEVKRTFDSFVTMLPSPFQEKASSKVVFTCRVCGKRASHKIPTFIVLETITPQASCHEYFNAAVPWTESLLPGSIGTADDASPNCNDCASDSSWVIETEARCKLVWLQYPRELHPLALHYSTFLGKDPFFVKGHSWTYIISCSSRARSTLW